MISILSAFGIGLILVICLTTIKSFLSTFISTIEDEQYKPFIHFILAMIAGMVIYPAGISNEIIKYGVFIGIIWYFLWGFVKN